MYTRREILGMAAAGVFAATGPLRAAAPAQPHIIDAHVHVWDLKQFHLPWISADDKVLNRDYLAADYLAATRGLGIARAVYVEVGLDDRQQAAEARFASTLSQAKESPFAVAVIGGDPSGPDFDGYITSLKDSPVIRGVRHSFPSGADHDERFLKSLRRLGELHLSFDFLLGPELLPQAARVAEACPRTQFILDHCGGADATWFRKDRDAAAQARADEWRRGIDALAARSNVVCKISGVAEGASGGKAETAQMAAVVNHCFDAFGPDRVLFASNWPVCNKATTVAGWLDAVRQIVASRPAPEQARLFSENARRVYRIDTTGNTAR